MFIEITAEEGDAPKNAGEWTPDLADASTICLVGEVMGDVDEAVDKLVTAVEREILVPEHIKGPLDAVNNRDGIHDMEMIQRIYDVGLKTVALRAKGATTEFLIRVAGDEEAGKATARTAKEILRTRGDKGRLAADMLDAGTSADDVIAILL